MIVTLQENRSLWTHAVRAGSALAGGMGLGRFAYTPILPMMTAQAGLSVSDGASLATANYAGYLIGALATAFAPRLVRSPAVHRASLVLLVVTLAAMPLAHSTPPWLVLRLLAGIASAVVFVTAASSLLGHLRGYPLSWALGGVGIGIALSGLLVLIPAHDWRVAWWTAAAVAALCAAGAWTLRLESAPSPSREPEVRDARRPFSALLASYTLEGVGYIIAGTFLVAAVEQRASGWIGGATWVLVGLAAAPSPALWAWLGRRFSLARPDLLIAALVLQAVGIALPAVADGVAPALLAAVLFGGTFLGISSLTLATGGMLRFPRAVALLTTGYSAGQILGPLIVTPLLRNGYHQALGLASAIVLAAAVAAWVLARKPLSSDRI
ncbi:YbfB/YjiJ family MFS transporter [Amycolatopsis sp. cg5]|uniref:YbfB/YjiJ family MFS transporter n=1 Tax=Amycolatopsis sp. cg5 TaxID=3238802 RepID=UPI00352466F1